MKLTSSKYVKTSGKNRTRILVCAPSNAAVDEIVLRFKNGIKGSDGTIFHPKVLRLGHPENISNSVQEFTLDAQASSTVKLQHQKLDSLIAERNSAMAQLTDTKKKLKSCDDEIVKCGLNVTITQKNKQIKSLDISITQERKKKSLYPLNKKTGSMIFTKQTRELLADTLRNADVVCATLCGSANRLMIRSQLNFDTVIIDEAAQSVEPTSLIPLMFGCTQCIMVGDHKQLPPTVFSKDAIDLNYNQSLFYRMAKNFPQRVHMLDVQFRMHPEISLFPRKEFYDGVLKDGPDNHMHTRRDWHTTHYKLGHYRFFNVGSRHERSAANMSLSNRAEALVILRLYGLLRSFFCKNLSLSGKVGIISPYKQQIQVLRNVFTLRYTKEILNHIEFKTVDGFQGQEKDIIFFSCVRSQRSAQTVGFLNDIRRLNVAITRAKSSLWIVGNESTLSVDSTWGKMLENTKERGHYTHVTYKMFKTLKYHLETLRPIRFPDTKYSLDDGFDDAREFDELHNILLDLPEDINLASASESELDSDDDESDDTKSEFSSSDNGTGINLDEIEHNFIDGQEKDTDGTNTVFELGADDCDEKIKFKMMKFDLELENLSQRFTKSLEL